MNGRSSRSPSALPGETKRTRAGRNISGGRAAEHLRGGAVAIEFAIIFPLFLSIVFGMVEVGSAMFVQNSLSFAAQEATRFAIVRGGAGGATAAQIRTQALNRLSNLNSAQLTVTVNFIPPNNNNPGSDVVIQTTYAYQPLIQFIGIGPFNLTAQSRMTIGW